jgi:arginine-tRNA-protein transferase
VKFGITQSFSCSYLPDEEERLLVYAEEDPFLSSRYSQLIQAGFRRSGEQIYRPHCVNCSKCQSVRIPVDVFVPSRSQKRVLKQNSSLSVRFTNTISAEYYPLYERYITERHSDGSMYPPSQVQFDNFIKCTWMSPFYLEAYDGDKLVAVAVTDVLEDNTSPDTLGTVRHSALSALYTFFDPDYYASSLGTWMILMQIEQAKLAEHQYVYLGYYVEGCQKMSYKHKFYPFEQFIDNQWCLFTKKPA